MDRLGESSTISLPRGYVVDLGALDLSALFNPSLIIPLYSIIISEIALYYGRLDIALWGHFLTLLYCALGTLVFEDIDLLQVFALVPLLRHVNLG
ncbi:MAG: hypothetical protein ABEI52_11960, partial [Halobacteriaceae archaeon]